MKAPFFTSILSAVALLSATDLALAQQLPNLPIQLNLDDLAPAQYQGSRQESCATYDFPLTALTYSTANGTTDVSVGSLTVQAQPRLWFYLPTDSEEMNAVIAIKNTRNELLYEGQLNGETESDGIVSVPLPVELSAGDPYQWVLTVECDENDSVTVDGWIGRAPISPATAGVFAGVGDRNRAALYANEGFLQDALSELALLRLADKADEDLAEDWIGFLSDLGLADLTAAPLLDCCEIADARTLPEEEIDEPETSEPEVSEPEVSEPIEDSVEPEEAEEPDTRTPLQRARDNG